MHTIGYLKAIRSDWIGTSAERLSSQELIRTSIRDSLEKFYDTLIMATEHNDERFLEPIIEEWIQARMQTEMGVDRMSISPVIGELFQITIEVSQKKLSDWETLELIRDVLPSFNYAYTYTNRRESQIEVEHISLDLQIANSALEKLDKSKSDFISIAAHELKTPLTLIEGYSAMVRNHIINTGDEEIEILLKGINNGTRRLAEIINDMIDVSLIDNNLMALNFQPVWINRLLSAIEQEYKATMTERNLIFEVNLFPGSESMNYADGERLLQAFRNLVINAIKFTPDGGSITIDGRVLPGFIEIIFSDTGIGIDPKDHSRIFEKFGRVGSATLHSSGKTKYKGGGPGLGLPITKGILEAHGGAIWVESTGYDEDKKPGASFHVLLPIREEAPDNRTVRFFESVDYRIPED